MLKKKRTWLALVMALIAGGLVYYFTMASVTTAQLDEPALQTATVRQGDIVISASGAGNLMPAAELDVSFPDGGTLVELRVQVGDEVEAGEVLASIDDAPDQEQLAQAHISLETAQLNLENAQASAAGAGDADELTAARINLKQATDALAEAQANYDEVFDPARDWELNDPRRANSLKAEREAAARALNNAKDNLTVAQSQYNLAVASLKDGVSQSESSLRSAQLSLDQAQLSLASAQQALTDTILTAPIAGAVSAINADVGESVGTSALLTLIDMSQPLVRFWIEEGDLDKAAVGNKVTVVFEALPDQDFSGTVVRVEPVLATVDNTPAVQAWATIEVPPGSGTLLSGMNAEVEVIAAEARGALIAPAQALRELSPGSYAVFVVLPNGELELRPVEVGLTDAVSAQIVSGLEAGEVVSTGTAATE
ncbi:MAG: efflux RND transporter periplasmic adaptor subunit [Anaerolineae bacterium]